MSLRALIAPLVLASAACEAETPSILAPTVEGAMSVAVVLDSGGALRLGFFGAANDNWSFLADDVDEIWLLYYTLPAEALRPGDDAFDCRSRKPMASYHLVLAKGREPETAPVPPTVLELLATEQQCNPCLPLKVVAREAIRGDAPRVARALGDRAVVASGDGQMFTVEADGRVTPQASIDAMDVLWTEGDLIWAAAPGYLARGTIENGLTTLSSGGRVGRKGMSIAGDGERLYMLDAENDQGDAELHAWNDTDARWDSIHSWLPSRDRWRLGSSGTEVFGIGPASDRVFRVTPDGVVEEQLPNVVSRLERIGYASELGVLVCNDAGAVYVREGPNSFRRLSEEGKLIETFVEAPGGFAAIVKGTLVQYVEGHGYCEPIPLTRPDLQGLAPVGDGFVAIGSLPSNQFEIIVLQP